MLNKTAENNRRILKNTVYLYARMAISLIIGLYTSRVILEVLGAEDYGINNIVGGFVGMLSLFTCSLSGATGRFITYELGKGNKQKLKDTFTTITSLIVILSGIVFFIGESIGIWFVKSYLVIPQDRWDTALYVYHCSIITFIVNLLALPYQSAVTAHEHFNFYAIVDIVNSLLKLIIVWLICISPFDKLGSYVTLLVLVGIIIRIIYGIYCTKHFEESKFSLKINKLIFKDIAVYSGWITIGASSAIFKEQGINVLINMFFGVLLNAARGIAMQVYGIVNQFSASISSAINPQITKSYAAGDIQRAISLTFLLAKAKGLMIIIIALPLSIEADYILKLWLGKIPDKTVLFVVWALVTCYARAIEDTHSPLFLATGKVRNLQVVGGGIMLLNLPISYLFLKMGFPAITTMQIGVTIELTVMFVAFLFLKHLVGFPVFEFYKKAILPQVLIVLLSLAPAIIVVCYWTEQCYFRLVINTLIIISSIILWSFLFILNNQEKKFVVSFVKNKIHKNEKSITCNKV